jgi:hypothetical protein
MPPALTAQQVQQINRALAEVGDYGEVRLIVEKGRLRFVQRVTSEEAASLAPRPAPTATFQPGRERQP